MRGRDGKRGIFLLMLLGKRALAFLPERTCCYSAPHKSQNQQLRPLWESVLSQSSLNDRFIISSAAASVLEDSEASVEESDAGGISSSVPTPTSSLAEQAYMDRFSGIGRLYSGLKVSSDNVLERMRQATVVVVGIGGVGSWAAEALCRSGVGNLILVDLDDVCISNTNRQLHATTSAIGEMKIDVMQQRLLDINPDCNVTRLHDFVDENNAKEMLEAIGSITALIDAIDGASAKSALIGACADLAIPVVTVGGAAGRRDPFQISRGDLVDVEDDRLLASCRKILRKRYNFPAGLSFSQRFVAKKKVRKWRISCVYTRELPPSKPSSNADDNPSSSFRLCDGSLGTACFVTGAYGFAAASIAVEMIASDKLISPRRA